MKITVLILPPSQDLSVEAVLAHSRNQNWRCLLSLSPSDAGPAVSALSRTLIASQLVLDPLALFLVGASSSRLNLFSNTKYFCGIPLGPGGELTVDVVPGGTELEPQVKTRSLADCTHSQLSSRQVYWSLLCINSE
jgi:hypothetical protein